MEIPGAHTFVTTAGLVVHNCFPKDSLALKQLAANSGYNFQLLNAVIEVNELQKRRGIGKLERRLGTLRGKKVALLGLAFKPGTDDMREAPSLVLAGRLLAVGAHVSAWDPVADGGVLLDGVEIAATALQAVDGADAAVLVTEWPELRELDWVEAGKRMRNKLIVDGPKLPDPVQPRRPRHAGATGGALCRWRAGGDPAGWQTPARAIPHQSCVGRQPTQIALRPSRW